MLAPAVGRCDWNLSRGLDALTVLVDGQELGKLKTVRGGEEAPEGFLKRIGRALGNREVRVV